MTSPRLHPTAIGGVWQIELSPLVDERGTFARTFCADTFAAHGLDPRVAQCSLATNHKRGTLRGMHYQAPPHGEAKLIHCVRGAVYDVALDLRPGSPTFGRWLAFELSEARPLALYLGPGIAHGYLTLSDEAHLHYQMSTPYAPEAARGVRWDDPRFAIAWPFAPTLVSSRDQGFPDYAYP